MGMYWKRWVGVTLVTALGAGTILEGQHVGKAIPPHVEVNLPPQPPKFQQSVAITGSGSPSQDVRSAFTATIHVDSGRVFIIRL
jgi:hypothetical protein